MIIYGRGVWPVCLGKFANLAPARGLLLGSSSWMGASTEDMTIHWGEVKRAQIGAIFSFPIVASRPRLRYAEERQGLCVGWVTNGVKSETE